MKEFKVYATPKGTYKTVKKGWSWPAFFFGPLWAFWKFMWAVGFLFFGIMFVIYMLLDYEGTDRIDTNLTINRALLVMHFLFGIYGNALYAKYLVLKGFYFKDTISATNGESGLVIYLNKQINHDKMQQIPQQSEQDHNLLDKQQIYSIETLRQMIESLRNEGYSYYLIAEDFNKQQISIPVNYRSMYPEWSQELIKKLENEPA